MTVLDQIFVNGTNLQRQGHEIFKLSFFIKQLLQALFEVPKNKVILIEFSITDSNTKSTVLCTAGDIRGSFSKC